MAAIALLAMEFHVTMLVFPQRWIASLTELPKIWLPAIELP